jgi:DNA repair protein RadD
VKLRPYQIEAIDQTLNWLEKEDGNLAVSLSTGSGKSVIIGEFCKFALQKYPDTKILMLTHVRELISQNHDKLKTIWPEAPVGIYSAGLNSKEIKPITYAGIQSIHNRHEELGHIDLILCDECHLISHKPEGMYRKLIANLKEINPQLRVIGYSATCFRVGHGYIHEGDGLFDGMIEPVTIDFLIKEGYLCHLRSKFTTHHFNIDNVKKRGGEYIEKDLQIAVDTDFNNKVVVKEMLNHGKNRRSWLVFCTGVEHSNHICDILNSVGINTAVITGDTPKEERDQIISDFKNYKIQALTSINVLSTGFDHDGVDMVVMLRPTMSPILYIQQVGRGLRINPNKEDCLVLDFAGNISTHGPITKIRPPKKKSEKPGEAPVKVCEHCQEIVHLSVMICPACGEAFPPPQKEKTRLHQDDIMGMDNLHKMYVTTWKWAKYTSQRTGKTMLKCTYYGSLSAPPVKQYFTIYHEGKAGDIARVKLYDLLKRSGVGYDMLINDASNVARACNTGNPPVWVEYEKNGIFFNVKEVSFEETANS